MRPPPRWRPGCAQACDVALAAFAGDLTAFAAFDDLAAFAGALADFVAFDDLAAFDGLDAFDTFDDLAARDGALAAFDDGLALVAWRRRLGALSGFVAVVGVADAVRWPLATAAALTSSSIASPRWSAMAHTSSTTSGQATRPKSMLSW